MMRKKLSNKFSEKNKAYRMEMNMEAHFLLINIIQLDLLFLIIMVTLIHSEYYDSSVPSS